MLSKGTKAGIRRIVKRKLPWLFEESVESPSVNYAVPPDVDAIYEWAQTVSTGILPYEDIQEAINKKMILDAGTDAIQPCSYDMSVGTIFKDGEIITKANSKGEHVILEPGEIISLFTKEELNLPRNIAATAFPMNSMSSEGILVLNPGHIDPGFRGPLTVRAINIRKTPKTIWIGMPIFTLVFERLPNAPLQGYKYFLERGEREKAFNANDVEQNPQTLLRLVTLGKEKPVVTTDQVHRQIQDHWMSWVVFAGTILSVLLAALAAIFAIIAVFQNIQSKQSPPSVILSPSNKNAATGQANEIAEPASNTESPSANRISNRRNINANR
jgi:deoxycytidine triphosphate deaminase